jgi:hypothetical protein
MKAPLVLYADKLSAIAIDRNYNDHTILRHIEVHWHLIREKSRKEDLSSAYTRE